MRCRGTWQKHFYLKIKDGQNHESSSVVRLFSGDFLFSKEKRYFEKGIEIHIKTNLFYPIQQNIGLYLNY